MDISWCYRSQKPFTQFWSSLLSEHNNMFQQIFIVLPLGCANTCWPLKWMSHWSQLKLWFLQVHCKIVICKEYWTTPLTLWSKQRFSKLVLFLQMLNQYTFNFTLEIASPIIALEMDFLKEEIFCICLIYIYFVSGELKCWIESSKTSFPNASGSSLFGCFILERCFKTVWEMAM